jgi:hypothetical protein
MLYVEQSLAPEEEVLTSTTFHWMYFMQSIFWIILGIGICIGIGYAGIWWAVNGEIHGTYGDLPSEEYGMAWHKIVGDHGGYMQILWSLNPVLRLAMLAFLLIGLFFFAHMRLIQGTTEIAVTNARVIYKKGLIARHVAEVGIDRIEGVTVDQGVMGRIFGYGSIVIHGMGVGEVVLPEFMNDPVGFRRCIQEAKSLNDKAKAGEKPAHENF